MEYTQSQCNQGDGISWP